MRVVHTVPSIAREASGPTYVVTRLCESLIEKKQRVNLAVLAEHSDALTAGSTYIKYFSVDFGQRRLGVSNQMRRWLNTEAFAGRIDLLHNHSLWMMPNVYPGRTAAKFRIPYVVSPHGVFTEYAMSIGSNIKKLFWPLIQKPSLISVGMFHATAESEYKDIRRLGFRQPVAIIPSGIDLPDRIALQGTERRTLLFLGRIHPNKGLDLLIPAWQQLQNQFPDWYLKIVGPDENDYLSEVKALVAKIHAERVEFVEPKFGKAKWDTYANSALFILPSYSENFGVAVAEALASGVPAIVTRGAPWQGLEMNQAGWWIDTSVEALVAVLREALSSSPEKLQRMGACGRAWMLKEYSWSNISMRMLDSYRWLRDGGPAPAWIITD